MDWRNFVKNGRPIAFGLIEVVLLLHIEAYKIELAIVGLAAWIILRSYGIM